jgi:hypothetical protein
MMALETQESVVGARPAEPSNQRRDKRAMQKVANSGDSKVEALS